MPLQPGNMYYGSDHDTRVLYFKDVIEDGFKIHSISNPVIYEGCVSTHREPNSMRNSEKWISDNDPAKFDNIPKSVIWEGTYGTKTLSNGGWEMTGDINFEPNSGTEYYMLDAAAWQFSSLSNFRDAVKELLKHSVILKDGRQCYLHDIVEN